MTPAKVLIAPPNSKLSGWLPRLREAGLDVSIAEADDPAGAVRLSHPDLLLLDVSEAALRGLAALEALRHDREWAGLPIILFNLSAGDEERATGLDAGADDYLTGSVTPLEIVARTRAVLRRASRRQTP
jgi:two-component system phosphate regulon response regulator PhoB